MTAFGGTLDSINWTANSCLVVENSVAKTIKIMNGASFGWGFKIKEK